VVCEVVGDGGEVCEVVGDGGGVCKIVGNGGALARHLRRRFAVFVVRS
jgi:hypothetical protein